ncbi:MAG: Brp/Blh family beta-carotene 15,15'-dioxygenase [Planctomycetota bacterium]
MHAAAVTLLCWAMIAAALFAPVSAATLAPVLLASLVAFVGLPHGAADHWLAGAVLPQSIGRHWWFFFLGGYLGVAALTVAGWFIAPCLTILAFFAASAWHFGREEPQLVRSGNVADALSRIARGGLVIWIPLLAWRNQVNELLLAICPAEAPAEVDLAVSALVPVSVFAVVLAAASWLQQLFAACSASGVRRRVLILDASLVASLVAVFALVTPVVSFPVYFCAWHSARGLRRLRRQLGESWRQMVMQLAPTTIASIALVAAGGAFVWRAPDLPTVLVRSTFLGLSAVAMPHLMLETVLACVAKRDTQATTHGGAVLGRAT